MTNNVIMYAVVVALAGATAIPSRGGPNIIECTYPADRMVTTALSQGMSLRDVARYLRENGITFSVFSADEQQADLSLLDNEEVAKLGPFSIIVVSRLDKKKRLVQERELLSIQFDHDQRLVNQQCEKRYIGP